jgi:4-deoxy-L-threo-5-hexosulose-uronate ketol-isomerase
MEIRFEHSPDETARMETKTLRSHFLAEELMEGAGLRLIYCHYDRLILGGAQPGSKPLVLDNPAELRATHFLERRECGIFNLGGQGKVEAGGRSYGMNKADCLYLEKGTDPVSFHSLSAQDPAAFFFLSAPAHRSCGNRKMGLSETKPVEAGRPETANSRSIHKYIYAEGIPSCQLVMGLTVLKPGSVWNTMPPHTHTRRTEVYFYFDMQPDHRVFHFMGTPDQTRHLLVSDRQAVISPPWSIHAGSGTASYSFLWGMAGENLDYADMDALAVGDLR